MRYCIHMSMSVESLSREETSITVREGIIKNTTGYVIINIIVILHKSNTTPIL